MEKKKNAMPATESFLWMKMLLSSLVMNKNIRPREGLSSDMDLDMMTMETMNLKKFKKYENDRAVPAAPPVLCSICSQENSGIIACSCPCGNLVCDDCSNTDGGHWRCGIEIEDEDTLVADSGDDDNMEEHNDVVADDDNEDINTVSTVDDSDNEVNGGDIGDDSSDSDDGDETEDDDDIDTHPVMGYDAHNGLTSEECLDRLNTLSSIPQIQQDKCINGIGDTEPRIKGLKKIYTNMVGLNFCSLDRLGDWSASIDALNLSFIQYINGVRHYINTNPPSRIRGGAHIDKLAQYFIDNS